MYVTREMEIVKTIDSVYMKIWGQNIDPLHKMINHIDELTVKHEKKEGIWLLKNLKTVSIGIDYLGNKCVNYFNALRFFVIIIQGPLEGDDGYIKGARYAIET